MKSTKTPVLIHYLPNFGCISTGILYVAIGSIAILSFLRIKDGGADEYSFLALLNKFTFGRLLIWIILTGTLSYIIWRVYETITDPYGYGNDKKGIAKRAGIALSTIADLLIAFAAIHFLLGIGNQQESQQLAEQQKTVSNLLQKNYGSLLVTIIGAATVVTALTQLLYGITRGYRERLEVEEFNPVTRKLVHFLGIAGYISRGVIIGIVGYFYFKAGLIQDTHVVVNTDKAFDFIGDHIGHFYFIVTAAGTIFYGLFMFVLGLNYDIDRN